jgi:hypothetical protein
MFRVSKMVCRIACAVVFLTVLCVNSSFAARQRDVPSRPVSTPRPSVVKTLIIWLLGDQICIPPA